MSSPVNLQLNNNSIEHNPTESTADGKLYTSKNLSYQLRNDLRLMTQGKLDQLL